MDKPQPHLIRILANDVLETKTFAWYKNILSLSDITGDNWNVINHLRGWLSGLNISTF